MSFQDILQNAGFWGFSGAFIWAAPEWLTCTFSGKGPRIRCSLEFVIRLITGGIAGYAGTPWALWIIHNDGGRVAPIATLIGLAANTAAPTVMNALTSRAAKFFKGSSDES